MNTTRQVFQTNTKWRWRTFQWAGRLLLFVVLLMIPVVIITLARGIRPGLPEVGKDPATVNPITNPVVPAVLNARELKKYKGYQAFLAARERNDRLRTNHQRVDTGLIRAAFYVDWDPQSFYSLQKNIDQLNMVVPEWFFIDPDTDTLRPEIDMPALDVMKKSGVKIIPLINNINDRKKSGQFDGALMHRILHNPAKRERLINDIVRYIHAYGLQGINVDFEEFREKSDEPIIAFQKELYKKLHPLGLLVTQDIMAYNEDFNLRELSRYNDFLFIMAYDEHYSTSVPGPVCSQQWVEKVLDEAASAVPPEKIITCIAAYGYDWPDHSEAATVTYQEALANAKQFHADIAFSSENYNNHYGYRDPSGMRHEVYFADAATGYNTMRYSDEFGAAGTAVWRLGSEDERLWSFYARSLNNASLREKPFDYKTLTSVQVALTRPDYLGDGEILDVVTGPEPGRLNINADTMHQLITAQQYIQLPTRYVIKKYGNVKKQVILSFDDGPDPEYTPQILDILHKEKVPASFFIVGMEAEKNLPLLKRIFREGHEIGNHTFTHPNIATVSTERAATEMETTRLLIEAVTGRSTILFRAPYNADAEPTTEMELRPIALSRLENYYTVGESIDPNDWQNDVNADSIYNRVIRQYESNPEKGIILLHDAGGNRQATVDALPGIIHYFKHRGVRFTTVSGLLGKSRDDVMPVVHSRLLAVDRDIAGFGYWLEQFLSAAFWLAIVLGIVRIAIMAVMASVQKLKSKRNIPLLEKQHGPLPAVSIIVPAYNEEITSVKTVQNLLKSDYPDFDIIFIDDGSRDATYEKVLQSITGNDRVKVFTKPNGGKASALNFGISLTRNDYVVCIDADTQLRPDAVRRMMQRFTVPATPENPAGNMNESGSVGAVAGNVKVGNDHSLLTKWQSIEYTTAQNFDRQAFDLVNGITVVPGAIGAFKKSAILEAGGFTSDTLAEDCDLTIRILRKGYRVLNCMEAIAVTEAPESLQQFMKQRFRWSYGIMQSFWKHRDALFNPKYKGLGMAALPNILIFQVLLPLLSPLADLMLIVSLLWNHQNPESLHKIELYYFVFLAVDVLVSVVAFMFEKEQYGKLVWLIPQRFVYRQLMYIVLFSAIRKAIKGESQGWGALKRTGTVREITVAS